MSSIASAAPSAVDTAREWFVNLWRPASDEGTYDVTEVEGEVPREIAGTLYRNGPSQQVLPQGGYTALHLFDGDGYVQAFRFEDGRLRHTSRLVRNDVFEQERQAGRYLLAGCNLPGEVPTDDFVMRVQPNTNVVHHGGRLLALVENALPFGLGPRSLDSLGYWELDGRAVGMSTSAHPKIDGRTGQMILHGYSPLDSSVQLYVIEPDGTVSLAETIEAPYSTMMHDAAITAHHVIFPLAPVIMDFSLLAQGLPLADCLRYEPDKGMRFGVRGRAAGSPTRWVDAPSPGYMFHFGNAYEEGEKLVFDVCFYPDGDGFLDGLRTARRGDVSPGLTAYPTVYEIDLSRGTCTERRVDDRGAEFPRLDDRRVGHPNRFGYCVRGGRPGSVATDNFASVVVKYDRRGGGSREHDFGAGTWCGEPVFVPRTPDAAEDDGFVLSVVYHGASDRSFLAVLDARHVDGEPLARCWLRHRVPMGFHGNFAAGVA